MVQHNIEFTKQPGQAYLDAWDRRKETGHGALIALSRIFESAAEAKPVFESILDRLDEAGISYRFLCAVQGSEGEAPTMDIALEPEDADRAGDVAKQVMQEAGGSHAVQIFIHKLEIVPVAAAAPADQRSGPRRFYDTYIRPLF